MRQTRMTVWVGAVVLLTASVVLGDLTDGLAAYYPFNGNANDATGSGNNGTVYGATLAVDRFGNPNSAYRFDGVDDYIVVPDSDSLDLTTTGSVAPKGTLAAWVNAPVGARDDYTAVVAKMAGSSGGVFSYGLLYRLMGYNTPGGYRVYQTTYGGAHDGSLNTDAYYYDHDISDGKWHHLAFTWDGPEGKLYIDGHDATELSYSGTGAMVSDFDLYIGRYHYDPHGTWYSWEGLIDEVRIYDRTLSAHEIREVAAVPVPGAVALAGLGLGYSMALLRRRRAL